MATVKEIKEALAAIESLDDARWQAYESDSRAGVQKAIQQRKKAIQADIDEDLRLENMLRYEKELINKVTKPLLGLMKLVEDH